MHTKESIHALLDSNPRAVIRALYCIHGRQTYAEQSGGMTRETNGVGFSKYDAPLLTDFVRQLNQGRNLSAKQLAITRNKMKHYWRQLVEVANENVTKGQAVEVVVETAAPAPYNASVSTDEAGRYVPLRQRMQRDGRCLCEDYDGERKCDWCLDREFDAEIQAAERAEEEARMHAKYGTW